MTTPSTSESGSRPASSPGPVRWHYHPWETPWTGIVPLLAATVAVFLLVSTQTGQTSAALVLAVLVLVAGWRILFPATYEIGPIGIKAQTLWRRKRVAWRDIERIEVRQGGVFLVPPGSIWGWWRGLYLPWHGYRDEVLSAIRRYSQRVSISGDSGTMARTVSILRITDNDDPSPARLD